MSSSHHYGGNKTPSVGRLTFNHSSLHQAISSYQGSPFPWATPFSNSRICGEGIRPRGCGWSGEVTAGDESFCIHFPQILSTVYTLPWLNFSKHPYRGPEPLTVSHSFLHPLMLSFRDQSWLRKPVVPVQHLGWYWNWNLKGYFAGIGFIITVFIYVLCAVESVWNFQTPDKVSEVSKRISYTKFVIIA